MKRELTLNKLPAKVLAQLDLETVFIASRCAIAAERLQVFRKLDGKELSAAQIAQRAGIHRKHCEPFLNYLVFLGLLKKRGNLYRNSQLVIKHFLKARSIDWTRLWSYECVRDFEALTVMEEVISTGRGWRKILGKERKTDYELVQEDRQWARDFTYALYDYDRPNAEILARNLELSNYRKLLDVGGGSGVMSFALVRANPKLTTCILEYPLVCEVANEIIRKERLSRRVKTLAGDMNKAIPRGFDVIMFWNIGFITTQVMKMAYRSLPEGGMVVRNCSLPLKPKTLPPSAFLHGYLSVRPQGQSGPDIIKSLEDASFTAVKCRQISKNLGVITAHKRNIRKRRVPER
ncbi:MAG: methyltransferase [Candidatus Zixiibacteriota bacterium]|nr:MAG: methyltransferase [candidate division Zixibacteria bacterium]